MPKSLHLYVAGKLFEESLRSFSRQDWRDEVCRELEERTKLKVRNLDPGKGDADVIDEGNGLLIFGRECYMIQQSDAVLVYLSDDISVGGSQEMLIAKHYRKPLIGIAPRGGKFNRRKVIRGRLYEQWQHPFVSTTCDYVVGDVAGAAACLQEIFGTGAGGSRAVALKAVKDMRLVDEAIATYAEGTLPFDAELSDLGPPAFSFPAQKGVVLDAERERMLAIRYKDHPRVSAAVRGRLSLPGGKVQNPSGRPRTFQQRVREETGINVEPQLPFSVREWEYERRNVQYRISATVYFALYQGGVICAPQRGNEVDLDRAQWVGLSQVNPEEFVGEERTIVRTFLNYTQRNPFALATS